MRLGHEEKKEHEETDEDVGSMITHVTISPLNAKKGNGKYQRCFCKSN